MPAALMVHDTDPKEAMLAAIGDISAIDIMHNQVLVGVYLRPEKTRSGIFLPDQLRAEDRYQGKVGLVLAKGPLAFVDDATNKFHGQNVEVGGWVFFRASDGFSVMINGVLCRLLEEVHVKGKVPAPDVIF